MPRATPRSMITSAAVPPAVFVPRIRLISRMIARAAGLVIRTSRSSLIGALPRHFIRSCTLVVRKSSRSLKISPCFFWRYVPGFSAEGEWPVANWGDILRMLRERLRFSQRELAQRAGVSTDAVYRAEKSSTPRLHGSTYRAIASALGVEPAEIDQMWKGEFTASVPLDEGRDRKGLPALPEAFMDEFVQSADDVYVECYEGTGLPGGIRNGDLLVFSRIVTPVTGMIAAVELADQHGYISKHIGLIRRAKGGGIEVHQSMPGLQVYAPSVDIRAVHPAIVCLTPRRVYPVDTEPHLVLQLPPPRDPRRRRLRKER